MGEKLTDISEQSRNAFLRNGNDSDFKKRKSIYLLNKILILQLLQELKSSSYHCIIPS